MMKKETAHERKKTVTVTLGPRTEELVSALVAECRKRNPGMDVTDTALAGSAMFLGLQRMAASDGMTLAKDYYGVYQ